MKAEEILQLIDAEVGDDWSRSNAHGVNLSKCLLNPPVKRRFIDSLDEKNLVELWVVLDEVPEDGSGYQIVFDEHSKDFGLATSNVFLGYYGNFLETLENM